jgi:nitronate monooxygenase
MRLTEVLGTELPIVQAPMAGVQAGAMAAAVCEAGALGSLPCAMLSVEAMRAELDLIRSRTSRPFNVNFFCHAPPEADARREAAWREVLAPYYAEFGIDASAIPAGPGRNPFSAAAADALETFRPAVVSFHFGLPAPELLARVKSWGSKVMCSATTVEEACWLESRGVDVVVAQGLEAGGHRGMFLTSDLATQQGTFALVPQVVAAVKIPVIAAGGIATADCVRAAMALGASGVQVGTSFLLCAEATTPAVNRAALLAGPRATALTNLFTGRPSRGIVNRVVREIGPINPHAPAFPLATAAIAPLRARAEAIGSGDFSPLWSGQNATGCREAPAAEIVRSLAAGLGASP